MDGRPALTVDGRQHLDSLLRAQSLQRRSSVSVTDGEDRAILTDDLVVYVAGCVLDTPDELERVVAQIEVQPSALVTVGGGERAGHVARIAHECGCPTGVIAQVVASCEEMNATIMAAMLAPRGVFLPRDEVWHVPFLLRQGMFPIMLAVPPYSLWESPDRGGLPEHGPEFGTDRLAEALGFGCTMDFHADWCDGNCA